MEFQVEEILSKHELGEKKKNQTNIERQLVQRPWSRKVRVRKVQRGRPSASSSGGNIIRLQERSLQ